jgi:arylsulfatase A-like enzyme
MRPDFVTEKNCPTLYALAQRGVRFAHHHSVYPSATEVNGTAISTGAWPVNSGIFGNSEYLPAIDWRKGAHTELPETVRKGDELTHNHYLQRSTMAEIVRQSGQVAMVAGAKPIALLPDRLPRADWKLGANIYYGATLPESLEDVVIKLHGPFPKNEEQITKGTWTTEAMIDPLWREGVPKFTFLWMNEPDISQHQHGPGSPGALKAIRNSDDNLRRILDALKAKNALETTDVIVVSDHGCSTVAANADLATDLTNAGISATRAFKSEPKRGEVLVVSNSGSTFVYVIGHDKGVIEKVVAFLQGWHHSGVIFTRSKMPGTFGLKEVHLDATNAPDVVVSLRWTERVNTNGVGGTVTIDGASFAPGQGAHVSLSPYDLHNTLIAAGPDFQSGLVSTLATGNGDVAPTVLHILGINPPSKLDGRVLSEAMNIKGPAVKSFKIEKLTASKDGWHQYLNVTEVNGVRYCDEGNGSLSDSRQ